jgi:hypothetical protein
MKDRLTKNGDLKGALAVDAEINRLMPPAPQIISPAGKLRLSKFKDLNEFTEWLV